ncbi:Efflux pump membrane transporter BepG [BD1-7 clade bacterium]|uniref:Efflux pump membrane transporter n=1 Tax=BD1-7 clade bacterium TaxID=2029982 RepID=A0A5S9QWF9_9GAMM|nr:Efflux pump membrane transporter BepG [BD1-7 clade bacterium]
MLTRFFIDRPISAIVIAIMMIVAGLIALPILPIALYPDITPPVVRVTASYPGANAETMVDAVTTPIERQINGVEGLVSIASTSNDSGNMTIDVTFEVGYDLNIAAVDVQNRVVLAYPYIPAEVIQNGINVQKGTQDLVMFVNLVSADGSYSPEYVSNYASINIVDPIRRIPGVGSANLLGDRTYAMRIWLDPQKLAGYNLTVNDVIDAIMDQNTPAAVGSLAGVPTKPGQTVALTLHTKGRLDTPSEFEDIVVSRADNGSLIYIRDIGRVELGSSSYSTLLQVDGKNSIGIEVNQFPFGNTLNIADQIFSILNAELAKFPDGLDYWIARDSSGFIKSAVKEVALTLLTALLLIVLVSYLFLQDLRATLITLVTIPVSLIGTFALMGFLGFSINMLSLFGMILAIGLVVDDAVVVIENISRIMRTDGLPAREAAVKAMDEVRGPIIASTLVMMAVFIPASFVPGISGQLYQQFALTIACSLGLSLINALTFTPSLASYMLSHGPTQKPLRIFDWFNRAYDILLEYYDGVVKRVIRRPVMMCIALLALISVTVTLLITVPRGFIPTEDQGFFYVNLQLPEGSTLERTQMALENVAAEMKKLPDIDRVVTVAGFSILTATRHTNDGLVVVNLKDFGERNVSVFDVIPMAEERLERLDAAEYLVLNAAPINGLSAAGGFEYILEDRAAQGLTALYSNTERIIDTAQRDYPQLDTLFSAFKVDTPNLYLDIDREKVLRQGVELSDLYLSLHANLGGYYVNDFNKYGQVYHVYVQADKDQRNDQTALDSIYVRNSDGDMIPVRDLVDYDYRAGVSSISRYNLYNAAHIIGSAAPGYTSGEAIKAMESMSEDLLSNGFSFEWTSTAYQEEKAGNVAPIIFALSLLAIFFILAVLYESWLLPLMILLAIPLAVLGALTFQSLRGLANDTFCQIALIMLIGLAAKNAILIVQFANDKYAEGADIVESVIYACNTRLRPIVMTAMAFVAGIFPLVIASGAGAAGRQSLGTAVMGGMIFSTVLTLLFIPVIYVIVQTFREKRVPNLREKTRKHSMNKGGSE